MGLLVLDTDAALAAVRAVEQLAAASAAGSMRPLGHSLLLFILLLLLGWHAFGAPVR